MGGQFDGPLGHAALRRASCELPARHKDRRPDFTARRLHRRIQIITDVAIDPGGNVWVANNWDMPEQGFKEVPEPALSTRFGGNGTVVFFGLAKPVRTPLIGPARAP